MSLEPENSSELITSKLRSRRESDARGRRTLRDLQQAAVWASVDVRIQC